jgi:preprotein translocase subunit YajC
MSILVLLPIFLIGYFLLVRPQQQQARRQRELVSSLHLGAEVQTSGGIVGRIVDLDDQFVQLQVGPNTTITFIRGAVQKVINVPQTGSMDLGVQAGDAPYGGEPIDLSEADPPYEAPSQVPDPPTPQPPTGESDDPTPPAGGQATSGPIFGGTDDQAGQPTQSLPVNPPSDPAPPPTWAPGSAEGGEDAPA